MSALHNNERLLSGLGLCVKAGKVVFGVPMICEAMRKGGKSAPKMVLEASDTSDNTHKRLCDKCSYYGVRLVRLECDGITLASAVGKSSQLGAVAVTDQGLVCMLEKYID